VGYSKVNVEEIEGVAVGARPGSYEPRGPF
jgi:hypothetical protein